MDGWLVSKSSLDDGWMTGWMNGGIDGRTDRWIDGLIEKKK